MYTFSDFIASNNSATQYGGVFYTDLFKPSMTNLTFSGNTAIYGENYAGHPAKIEFTFTTSVLEVVSGQTMGDLLTYVAYDLYDQVASTLGQRLAALQINNSNIELQEQSRASSVDGKFSFSSTIIIGDPGTSGVLTFLTSALDLEKYRKIFGTTLNEVVINTPFDIRYCARGEAQDSRICIVCPQATYTLIPNSTNCLDCPENAS